jgi:hypothetical protein
VPCVDVSITFDTAQQTDDSDVVVIVGSNFLFAYFITMPQTVWDGIKGVHNGA